MTRCRLAIMVLLIMPAGMARGASPADAAALEFFEKNIRPILAEHCYRCHGAETQEAGLRLDNTAAIKKGGDRGPVVAPGNPDESLLIQAVRYTDLDLQMPPKGKLPQAAIADLQRWVVTGAAMPDEAAVASQPFKTFDMDARLQHWCYQPLEEGRPPQVQNATWPTSPIDNFILARLEQAGLQPAPPADKHTLIRRVTFDLIGLPPTPEEVQEFVSDTSPDAYERLIDRLLDSPHYGERWARHWLDLVRYADTMGHEFDFEIFHAWRYRDYVIRAFNADVPYDQFVVEHVAGDLLPEPRRHPVDGLNESILGTGFWWLGEGKHSPVDIRQEQADHIDNRLDVFGKLFLAQTIACARCHDHKFDAIATKDYYALAGYLKSTRYQQAAIDAPEKIAAPVKELQRLKGQMAFEKLVDASLQDSRIAVYLFAAYQAAYGKPRRTAEQAAAQSGLDATRLARWIEALTNKEAAQPHHPLWPWRLAKQSGKVEFPLVEAESAADALTGSVLFEDFSQPDWSGWYATGEAFGPGPTQAVRCAIGADDERHVRQAVPPGWAHSGLVSRRLEGVLRSETFELRHPYVHFLAAGKGSRINLIIDGFTLIRSPIYGGLTIELKDDRAAWRTMDVSMWQGHRAYIELIDSVVPNPTQQSSAEMKAGQPGDGYLAIDEIRFSNEPRLPLRPHPILERVFANGEVGTLEELAQRYQDNAAWLLPWLVEQRLFEIDGEASAGPIAALLEEYRRVEHTIPLPTYAPAACDGTGEDEHVFVRGNYRALGEPAPRQLLPAVHRAPQPRPKQGSGRLELARRLVDPNNPLLARVMVNRLWQHHFGQGLVRTPDDFGRMGQLPTHPQLLDYLAAEFIRSGWSIKAMHRQMVLSSTYRMASRADSGLPDPSEVDPGNLLLHRMNVRRLEAEAIRDAILAVSGRLDRSVYGPSVLPHLTPFMEGRGRPASGPVDGEGRRSIYIGVRRNFLPPLFLAFDFPIPFTTIGRRSVSNVPAQALALMNDPLIVQQAGQWARRVLALPGLEPAQRIEQMYLVAFARLPQEDELAAAKAFVQQQSQTIGDSPSAQLRAWTDLCHVLLNAKEFIFIP